MNKTKFKILDNLRKPCYPLLIPIVVLILDVLFLPISENCVFKWLLDNKFVIILWGIWAIYSILHTTCEDVVKILFNPCSPIITLIVGWLLTLLVTEANKDFKASNDFAVVIINFLLEQKIYILILLVCWLAVAIMYTNNEQQLCKKDKEILKLNKVIEEKKNQLNQSNGIILNKYGDFAIFTKKNRFKEALQSFVCNNDNVDSAQIYRYSLKYTKDYIKIKVEYEEGFAYEGVDINNILQTYYKVKKEDYKDLKYIIEKWKKYIVSYHELTKKEKNDIEDSILNNCSILLDKIHNNLNSKSEVDELLNEDFDSYRVMLLLIRILTNNDSVTESIRLLKSVTVEEYLNTKKRTGILGSILLEDAYVFRHVGKGSKIGRTYVSFHLEVYSQNYIVLFALSPGEMEEDDDDSGEWKYEFEKMKNDFIKRLMSTSNEKI